VDHGVRLRAVTARAAEAGDIMKVRFVVWPITCTRSMLHVARRSTRADRVVVPAVVQAVVLRADRPVEAGLPPVVAGVDRPVADMSPATAAPVVRPVDLRVGRPVEAGARWSRTDHRVPKMA